MSPAHFEHIMLKPYPSTTKPRIVVEKPHLDRKVMGGYLHLGHSGEHISCYLIFKPSDLGSETVYEAKTLYIRTIIFGLKNPEGPMKNPAKPHKLYTFISKDTVFLPYCCLFEPLYFKN